MYQLIPHPSAPHPDIDIRVDVARTVEGDFVLRYVTDGDIARVKIPAPDGYAVRCDGLWKTTCFEAFILCDSGYLEFNFAPSTAWAAYRFKSYRQGGETLALPPPIFDVDRDGERFTVTISLDMTDVSDLPANQSWFAGLSAVIEAKEGTKSYWALAHSAGPPDFHNRDCFTASLAAPDPI